MLFSLKPKERRDELFSREKELRDLHRLIRSEWVIILGRRMTGKTSLLKTFLREVNGIYVNLMGVNSIQGLALELMKTLKKFRVEVDIGLLKFSWSRLIEDIFLKLEGKVIGLDEVQELPSNSFLKLLRKLWDTYDIRLILTGSMAGVINKLLEPEVKSPFYGRQPVVLKLHPFSKDKSKEFLIQGFREHGLTIREEELKETVELLNGYVGWLTYYGNFRCIRKLKHRETLNIVYEEGKKIMLEELNRFLKNKRNKNKYVELLKNLPARWSELEKKLAVNKKILRDMLKGLRNAMIIEKIGTTYTIPDPILRKLILEI